MTVGPLVMAVGVAAAAADRSGRVLRARRAARGAGLRARAVADGRAADRDGARRRTRRARRHRQRRQQRGRPRRRAARGRGAPGRGRAAAARSTPTRSPSTRRTATAMIICAVLLAVGGVVSWLTIRNQVLEEEDPPARRSTDRWWRTRLSSATVRITKQGAHAQQGLCRSHDGPAAGARALRGAADAPRSRRSLLEHVRAGTTRHGDRLAEQGAGRDPRPGRTADRPRLRRRAPPRRPDGARPRRARRRSATGSSARASPGSSCPAATPTRPATYPDALSLLEDLAALGRPFPHVGHHRLPRVAPDHPRRPHRAVDVGQAALRHPHRQQPDLRPGRAARAGYADCGPRGVTMPLLLGIPGPVDRTKLLAMATKIGVGESTRFLNKHKGTFARLAAPGGFTGERFLEKCAPALVRARRRRRGPARLHLQPGRGHRGLAPRPAGAARPPRSDRCESSPTVVGQDSADRPSQRSIDGASRLRERRLEPASPVSTTVSGRPIRSAAASASARSSSVGSWASHTTRV